MQIEFFVKTARAGVLLLALMQLASACGAGGEATGDVLAIRAYRRIVLEDAARKRAENLD